MAKDRSIMPVQALQVAQGIFRIGPLVRNEKGEETTRSLTKEALGFQS